MVWVIARLCLTRVKRVHSGIRARLRRRVACHQSLKTGIGGGPLESLEFQSWFHFPFMAKTRYMEFGDPPPPLPLKVGGMVTLGHSQESLRLVL